MTFQIRQAERRQSRLRLALIGSSGAGKTLSSLLIAHGLTDGDWSKVGMIDTENGRGEFYEGMSVNGITIGRYQYGRLGAPYTAARYLEAIRAFEAAGVEVLIIDSLSHAWAAEGGILDKVDRAAERSNKFAAWRQATPDHNSLVEALIQSPAHIIACMRAKTEYVMEKDERGSTTVRKVGLAPVQRDGIEYEFVAVADLNAEHVATFSKDNTSLYDGRAVRPSPEMGRAFRAWLEKGAPDTPTPTPPGPAPNGAAEPKVTPSQLKRLIALRDDLGLSRERDDILRELSVFTRRTITSRNDLTMAEAERYNDSLANLLSHQREQEAAGEAEGGVGR